MTATALENFTTLAVVIVSLGFVAVKFNQLIGQNLVEGQLDPRSTGLWLFSLCLGLGLLFRAQAVYAWLNARLGIHNLSWLLSCFFLTLSVWVLVESCLRLYNDFYRVRQIIAAGLIVAETIILFVFWRDIAPAPEYYYPGSPIPQHGAEVAIKSAMMSYAAMTTLLAMGVYYRLFQKETVLPAKIRWFLSLAIMGDVLVMIVTRLLLTLSHLFTFPSLFIAVLKLVTWVTQALVVWWPFAFLPVRSSVYTVLSRLVLYVKKLYVLQNLLALQHACEQTAAGFLASPALSSPLRWKECLRYTDRCVYKLLIAILDYKSELRGVLQPWPDWLVELVSINDNVDYATQIQTYSRLGQRLRKDAGPF